MTCGKGYKHRQTWCQFGEDRLDDRFCGSSKPESVQTCQQQECASWQVGPWGQVSRTFITCNAFKNCSSKICRVGADAVLQLMARWYIKPMFSFMTAPFRWAQTAKLNIQKPRMIWVGVPLYKALYRWMHTVDGAWHFCAPTHIRGCVHVKVYLKSLNEACSNGCWSCRHTSLTLFPWRQRGRRERGVVPSGKDNAIYMSYGSSGSWLLIFVLYLSGWNLCRTWNTLFYIWKTWFTVF